MEKEYRIVEKIGLFFIEEKVYRQEDYTLKESFMSLFFTVPLRYYSIWKSSTTKTFNTIQDAKDFIPKLTPKYHEL